MAAETVGADGEEEVFVDSCALADHGLSKEDDALGWKACDKCHHKKLPKHMMNVGSAEVLVGGIGLYTTMRGGGTPRR